MTSRREFLETVACWEASASLMNAQRAADRSDLTRLSLHEVSTRLRRKTVSPIELTRACLSDCK